MGDMPRKVRPDKFRPAFAPPAFQFRAPLRAPPFRTENKKEFRVAVPVAPDGNISGKIERGKSGESLMREQERTGAFTQNAFPGPQHKLCTLQTDAGKRFHPRLANQKRRYGGKRFHDRMPERFSKTQSGACAESLPCRSSARQNHRVKRNRLSIDPDAGNSMIFRQNLRHLRGGPEFGMRGMEERIQNELLENAALEESGDAEVSEENTEEVTAEASDNEYADATPETADALGDYLNSDDVPDYLLARADAEREQREIPFSGHTSFYERLHDQISEHDLTERETELMEYLIGSLDDDGLLRKDTESIVDELAIYHGLETTVEEVDRLVGILQTFDPRGIGARSLQECLHLQLADPDYHSPYKEEALTVVDKYFDEFIHKHWETICRRLGITEERFAHVKAELLRLNPRPGNALGENEGNAAATVIPDFIVTEEDGEPVVRLNGANLPELHVSRAFRDSLKEYDINRPNLSREQRDAYLYARQKVEAAQGFIDALKQRQHTLLSVMSVIVALQRPFFEDGDEARLRPMILKDVAERAGVDISTVSRVTGSKYVQTDFGVYPLKFFFSNLVTDSGGEEHSTRKIKLLLREMIDHEDKRQPLTDDKLSAMLAEKGFPVARRTVAKYREQLGLPIARMRR